MVIGRVMLGGVGFYGHVFLAKVEASESKKGFDCERERKKESK